MTGSPTLDGSETPRNESHGPGQASHWRPPSAEAIRRTLDGRVVGQSSAKEDLSTLLAMHLAWFLHGDENHTAPNALLIGSTGVGKTHAIRTAAQFLNVPLVIVDATRLSPQGYSGTSLEDILLDLISVARKVIKDGVSAGTMRAADFGLTEFDELDMARRGVVFIDEFDKLNFRVPNSERNDLLQRRLLQFIDGTTVALNNPASGEKEILFDTAGLLFIMSGAFVNLLENIHKRPQKRQRLMQHHNYVVFEDLVQYGFLKELIARLPVVIEFDRLGADELVQIMNNDHVDPSVFYRRYLESFGVRLEISGPAKRRIAEQAASLDLGARGLHQVLFPLLSQLSQRLQKQRPSYYLLEESEVRALISHIEVGQP